MERFYLDTQVFAYLVEEANDLSRLAIRLKQLVHARVIEVFGSLELLGEFVPRSRLDAPGFRRLVDYFDDVLATLSGKKASDSVSARSIASPQLLVNFIKWPVDTWRNLHA